MTVRRSQIRIDEIAPSELGGRALDPAGGGRIVSVMETRLPLSLSLRDSHVVDACKPETRRRIEDVVARSPALASEACAFDAGDETCRAYLVRLAAPPPDDDARSAVVADLRELYALQGP